MALPTTVFLAERGGRRFFCEEELKIPDRRRERSSTPRAFGAEALKSICLVAGQQLGGPGKKHQEEKGASRKAGDVEAKTREEEHNN